MRLPWNKEDTMIAKAKALATRVHKGQKRWGGEPFIVHPEGVVDNLHAMPIRSVMGLRELDYEDKTPFFIVGWLHDVVEDTSTTLGNLLDMGFDYRIVESVDAITRRGEEDYCEYIQRVKKDAVSRYVKIADIEHNLSTFDHKKSKSRADKYKLAIEVLKQE